MKNVIEHLKANNPERIDGFKAEAQAGLKELLSKFGDLEFFMGESMSPDGQVALLNYREDGITPYFTLWKDGLKGQKIQSPCSYHLIFIHTKVNSYINFLGSCEIFLCVCLLDSVDNCNSFEILVESFLAAAIVVWGV